MYLRGSKWSMSRKRKRSSPFLVIVLLAMIGGLVYFDRVVVPTTPPLFVNTPTPTRSPDSYIKDAGNFIQKGKINQAIETYKEAVKADPQNPAVYITLARWQVLYGDLDGAMENAQNALLINPNHALAHAVVGWILGKQGKYADAEQEITTALGLDPNSALAYAFRAEILKDQIEAGDEDLNTRDKAANYSKTAVSLDPSLLEVRRARGLVLEVTGNYELAIKEFEAAVAINENLEDLHLALGRNYKAVQIYDKAEAEFNRAIALKPTDPEPYAELARTYLTLGEFAKGVQLSEQAVERAPQDPVLHGLLGTLNYKALDYNMAVKSLRLAVNGGMTDTGVKVVGIPMDKTQSAVNLYSRYGLALANVGQCGEALQISQKIMQVVPDNEDAVYNAQVMIDTCKQQAENPGKLVTSTPAVVETEMPAPTAKP